MDMPMSPEIGPAQEIGQCLLARAPEHHRNGGAGCSVPRRDPKGCHILRPCRKNAWTPISCATRCGLVDNRAPLSRFSLVSEKETGRPCSEERFRVPRQVVAAGPLRTRIPKYPCLRPDRRFYVERARRNDHGFELRDLSRHDTSAVAAELARKALRFRDFVELQELFPRGEGKCPVLYHDVGCMARSGGPPAPLAVAMIEGRRFSFHFIADRTAKTATDEHQSLQIIAFPGDPIGHSMLVPARQNTLWLDGS